MQKWFIIIYCSCVAFLSAQSVGSNADIEERVRTILNGMTLEETAALSGLSVSGVRKRLRTLRKSGIAMQEV